MLNSVNLGITGLCNGSCRFCARRNGGGVDFMPMELIEKILDEVSSPLFKSKHRVSSILVGENCEATLHPSFLDILRKVKNIDLWSRKLPLFTNLSCLDKSVSETIVKEGLVTDLHTNIDGVTEESYSFMKKGLNYGRLEKNLTDLLKARGDMLSPKIGIHILTADTYRRLVYKFFGHYPRGMEEDRFDSLEMDKIVDLWAPFLNPAIDVVYRHGAYFWAERYQPKVEGDFWCTQFRRREEAFIAPNGDWYFCCMDFDQVLVLGNLYEQTLDEIYGGEKRKNLMQMLRERRFEEIGPPCDRVDCCQARQM